MTAENPYPTNPAVNKGTLPNPFTPPNGVPITTAADWPAAAQAWRDLIVEMEYGGLPPQPTDVEIEILCRSQTRHWPQAPMLWSFRIHCHGGAKPFSFCGQLLFPQTDHPLPVIINGDSCWWYLTDDIVQRVVASGCALLLFNRTEIVEDLGYDGVPDKHKRSGGLYDVYPGQSFGAIAAWAWGYHRCVDLLLQLPFIDAGRIAIAGHSRGGKTVLVAGATDERIGLVNDNGSCAGGSATFRYVGHGGETLDIINVFPSWFGPGLRPYLNQEEQIPFDQHCLLAAIAPRPLLLTYALDDRWSNPEGMVQCAWATGEVYRFLNATEQFAFHLRPGGHAHAAADWEVLLDFVGWHWGGKRPLMLYNQHPYGHLRPAFSWQAPSNLDKPEPKR